MSLYLSARKLDVNTGGKSLICVINEKDTEELGIYPSINCVISWAGLEEPIAVVIDTTDSIVEVGEIGLYEDIWDKYKVNVGEVIKIELMPVSKSIEGIRKKIGGGKLNYSEIFSIISDISRNRLGDVLTAYFVAAGYNPGFDKEEIFYMTKAMAETGDILNFRGIVCDKHSVGGIAGKGITPIVIPIVATFPDLIIPNTSSRAVTSASATSDMLEVIMPMTFSKDQLENMMLKNNAFMVWGGGLDLAPADDRIIQVQKPLGVESIDKFVASIISKKLAQGVNHVIFDIPVGKGAKIENEDEFQQAKRTFELMCSKFNIKVVVHKREISGIDGFAVGPALECREFLRVYERHEKRSLQLEEDALKMAGELIELCGKKEKGQGYVYAKEVLNNGKAYTKLKEIIEMQGGNKNVKSEDLEIGGVQFDFRSESAGVIGYIDNKKVFEVCKALGNPHIKEAGLYFHKKENEKVEKGDVLATLFTTNENRMQLGKRVINDVEVFIFKES